MRIQQYIVSILFVMTITGCIKDFDLDPEAVKPLYVIEGRISNMWGPYYVRITKSTGLVANPEPGVPGRDSAEAVKNALVIITDDTGIKDTLIPGTSTIDQYVYYFRDSVTYRALAIDSVFATVRNITTTHERGYYQTTRLKGMQGHTYYLEVHIGDTIFRSSAYMPPVPELERTELVRDTALAPYLNRGAVPVAWFKDPPNEKNYYGLYMHGSIDAYRYDYFLRYPYTNLTLNSLPYYVFDDKLLTSDVNRIAVRYRPINFQDPLLEEGYYGYWTYLRWPTQIRLHSFTKEAYDYLNVLYKQLEDNGHIYKPAPASARGNISGGALGLFYATGISDKLTPP